MDESHKKPPVGIWTQIVLVVLSLILLAVLIWLGSDLLNLKRTGTFGSAISRIHRRSLTRPTLTPDQIQGWMTFHYLNYVFDLPASFLQTQASISDADYPNITLDKYASRHQLDAAAFILSIKTALIQRSGGVSP